MALKNFFSHGADAVQTGLRKTEHALEAFHKVVADLKQVRDQHDDLANVKVLEAEAATAAAAEAREEATKAHNTLTKIQHLLGIGS